MEDAILMEMALNVKAIMVQQENQKESMQMGFVDLKEDICYLTGMKNKHEERISAIELCIPQNLDQRLRSIEGSNVKFTVYATMIATALTIILTGVINLLC